MMVASMMAVLALSAAGLSPPRLPARTSRSERRFALRRLRGGATADPIDEKLYSRQLYVMGRAAQLSLGSASVLLLGLTGLGAEVSKNLALAGVAQLDVHDAEEASLADLSSSWLLKPEDVGTARHAQAVDRLAPLNEHVRVRALGGDGRPLAEGDGQAACRLAGADGGEWWEREGAIDGYTVVVACDMPHAPLARLSAAARASGAKLVACWSAGLAGGVFVDCGEAFVVSDPTGEPPRQALLEHVSCGEEGVATTVQEQPHGLQDGDVVRFEGVRGMEALCAEGRTFAVRATGRHTLSVGDTRGCGEFVGGGRLVQVKQPVSLDFKPFEAASEEVGQLLHEVGGRRASRSLTLHAAFAGLHALPAGCPPGSDQRGAALLAAAREAAGGGAELDEALLVRFGRSSGGALAPVSSFIGGVAAQEALKAVTGKFTPLRQFLYWDALEALPAPPPAAAECAPRGDRYDGSRAVIGEAALAALRRGRYFVVGAGALGCEWLKCLALLGAATDGGVVHVTDMDQIERSNLNRQFLFRPSDLGAPKSTAAAAKCAQLNPAFRAVAHEAAVGAPGSPFDDAFWGGLDGVISALDNVMVRDQRARQRDGVISALDNVAARLHVDRMCVLHRKPLLESGTAGTKANTQVVLPGLTASYGASADPPDDDIPVCTVKAFPYAFWNSYLKLGFPLVALSEPEPPETFQLPASADGARGEAWSEWSRVEVDGGGGELRLSQLVARLEERFGHEVSFLSTSGGMLLYSPLSPPASQQRWLSMGVGAAVDEALGGGRGGERLVQLQASLYDEESEEDVEAPPILYRRRD
ncbi:hypothetical protein EMIHUDRAFT_459406 [Emiliania huxleyi CCMP1516]|uniref:Ubiquitin-activating enzyme E1 C-terminal domain-containing protein n=2 Tax=Emiliania huxleyi TaxID=2903 RepID=A0A0D3IUV5_EMIH1|nr:hypothetical protein EMIHUDRAFT_459406 [Emiliania huxleyi CCMP1516]EOD15040.1 hypothetical protein EMIHUDRAFT_459406 [Emiliania huxleyi CCMP1516]|eukprot:XP_005767469.1 hypothetical protein EMIHUDRAFT_459406 [Emiliania huxleyi CCMP1516]